MFITLKRHSNIIFILIVIIILLIFFIYNIINTRQILTGQYRMAVELLEQNNYQQSINLFNDLGNYKESINYSQYAHAKLLYYNGYYQEAFDAFVSLGNFLDSKSLADNSKNMYNTENEKEIKYNQALENYKNLNYQEAITLFYNLQDYKDSTNFFQECNRVLKLLINSNTISAGIRSSVAIKTDGSVMFSGKDFAEEQKILSWTDIVSISTKGEIVIGLKKDGSVVIAQRNAKPSYRIDVSGWNNITAVCAGERYIVGLKDDGTLTAQGHNGDGQINIDDWTNIVAIATGWRHTVGLDSNSNIYIAGHGSKRQLEEINKERDKWNDIIAISAGGGGQGENNKIFGQGHTVALKKDGTVVAVGSNEYGQCDVDDWENIIAISAGDFHTVGLKSDHTVVTTDPSMQNKINSWTDIVAVSAGYGFTLGIKSDGTVVAAGYSADGQTNVSDWKNILICKESQLKFNSQIMSLIN